MKTKKLWYAPLLLAGGMLVAGPSINPAAAAECKVMRKLNIGVAVSPPNVVHTTPYVAQALGFFKKHCLDVSIIQFEGGSSPAAKAAAAQGTALVPVTPVAIGRGVKVRQIWGLAPRLPQSYMVSAGIKTAKDLKGKKLSAVGGGVGGFNWIMGVQVLKSAGLKPDDAQFIAGATAGRLPGLVSGQINGVSLHPESVYLAHKKNPGLHVLVRLADLMPDFYFNAYGGQTAWIEKNHDLMVDAVAAMIEASRTMYQDEAKVVPIIMKATGRPKDAVEYAWKELTEHCVWTVNTGYDAKRIAWTVQHDYDVGYIKKKPTVEQVFNPDIANEAVKKLGGPISIGKCKE